MIALDATFRDGGYYNNWEFDVDLVNEYINIMQIVKINAIEIGFRSPPKKNVGKFAKVTDFFIEDNLNIPNIDYFGVMINGADYDLDLAKKMFRWEDESPINLVRCAVHFTKVDEVKRVMEYIKGLGYTTCLNLMQAADKSYDEIRDVAAKVEMWNCIDVLYIADSLGGMDHDTVNYAFRAVREEWEGLMGFHGHNNKGLALNNTLEAVDIGVEWIDSTMMGMGRGPGNTETEYLLNEMNKRNFEFDVDLVYELSMKHFYNMKHLYNWGPSLPYYLAAEYNIHPTYIQKMLTNHTVISTFNAIEYLKDVESNSFNEELMKEALSEKHLFDSCEE